MVVLVSKTWSWKCKRSPEVLLLGRDCNTSYRSPRQVPECHSMNRPKSTNFFTRDIVIPMYSHHINTSNLESRSSLSVKKPCLITHHSSAFHLSASSLISTILLLDRSTTHTLARILCAYDNVHPSTVHSNAAQTPSLGQRHQFHPGINKEKETVAMHAHHAPML